MKIKFLRRQVKKYSKLGKGRKKKQKWRKPKGRDNKMREKKKSRPKTVSIGYRTKKQDRGKIKGKTPLKISNLKQAENITKGQLIIISKIGKKKRNQVETEILKKQGIILNKIKEKKNEPKN